MTRPRRIALISAGSLVGLAVAAGIAGLLIARSDWLQERLRTMVVQQAEKATGGRVEIGKFRLDWTGLTADIDGLVIHGTEAATQAPFVAVDHVTVGFRIIALLTKDIRLERIEVVHPKVHLIVDAQGGTNLPRPKTRGTKNTADTILDLKIGRFDVRNGEALVESPGNPPHVYPWTGTGRNLVAQATYDPAKDRYSGDLSLAPLHLTLEGYGPLDVEVAGTASMERNQIIVPKVRVKTEASDVTFTGLNIGTFAAPVVSGEYDVHAAAAEAVRVLHWKLPVAGALHVAGKVRYVSPKQFDVSGAFQGSGMSYANVRNIRLAGNVAASAERLSLTSVRANLLGGEAAGSAETKGYENYRISGRISGFGVRSLAALRTSKEIPYDGTVAGTVEATGRISDISRRGLARASAQLTIAGPTANGEISADYRDSRLELAHSWIQLPSSRVDVTGTLGSSLDVKLESKDLNDFLPLADFLQQGGGKELPVALKEGSATFAGTVTGPLDAPQVDGRVELRNAVYQGRLIESAAGDVTATAQQARVANGSVTFEGMKATGAGSIQLADWQPNDASAITGSGAASGIDVTHALTVAGYKDLQVTGSLQTTLRFSGTAGQPSASGEVVLSNGLVYRQPYDSISGQVQYTKGGSQTAKGTFVSGAKRVTFDATYSLPGSLQISAGSNVMALNQIALVRQRQPDIGGAAQFQGTATLAIGKDHHVDLIKVDGTAALTKISLGGRDLGDSHIVARTQGNILTATFDSDAAHADIRGQAQVELRGDDRTTGTITFSNAGLNAMAAVIVTQAQENNITFDGSAEGQVDFSGPLFSPSQFSATATVRQLEVHPLPGTPLATSIPGFSLRAVEPLKVSVEKSVLRVDSAHFQAPETDLTLSGTADLRSATPLNLRVQGDISLAMIRNFVPDLASSGTVSLRGNIRGAWSAPDLNGSASIRKGEFHYADFSNGLTNATGEIVFSGNRAQIQSFSADTGGGKFTGTGFATLTNGAVAFQFSAKTKDVRLRYPAGISSISDSEIQLVHNAQRSSISGTVTVRRLVFNPQQDTAGILADISHSAPIPSAGDDSLAGMNLDVQIQTAPDVALQSKVAESIQADASLRLRGTISSPALLGRVNISQGSVLFFGNKYTISRGTISFYNPTKIDPILDVDLQTRARGVDVTLTVTGPPSHLGFTYRSDPPLEFSDIVALLATGRTPDDPSLALRGNAPTPTFEQLGASTLIGQTLATPLAGRLQRFFGVSRIKIDPQLAGVGGTPGARLTVEQQVTPDILFTYITDVANTSQQLIRAEWAFNQRWSAILAREENGYVGVDFEYKRRFK
ncbi:MAG TPA: translocation/assembly module TamB domain-containing protein [Bryobacteraceae bacterium]|nr:translocation/assembly module TamB domain-containing protein [Bryobacteraceae bacterium]